MINTDLEPELFPELSLRRPLRDNTPSQRERERERERERSVKIDSRRDFAVEIFLR